MKTRELKEKSEAIKAKRAKSLEEMVKAAQKAGYSLFM